jgi:hypothetical protein
VLENVTSVFCRSHFDCQGIKPEKLIELEKGFIIKFLHKIQALNDNYDQHKIAKKEEDWE